MINKLLIIICMVLLCSCARSNKTNYYLLNSVNSSVNNISLIDAKIHLSILSIEIPTYLNRDQVVIRDKSGNIVFSEFDYWAEPLNEGIRRVLIKNLSTLLPSVRVDTGTSLVSDDTLDIRLKIKIEQFERDVDRVVLSDQREIIFSKQSIIKNDFITIPFNSQDNVTVINVLNRLLDSLSRDIAKDIKGIIEK